ncbi:MAG: hypothetical protein BRC36_09430 [Cyanobacteria bacterium QH_2_48_84]|nr:MAG: hypothetical protein BRC36_09430 [Cyanobacteria bacterium QH_2_48_84]
MASGIAAGPAGGMMTKRRSRNNLAKARTQGAEVEKASEEMEKATSVLSAINEIAKKFDQLIWQLSTTFTSLLDKLESTIAVAGIDYAHYDEHQKRQFTLLFSLPRY